MNFFIGLERIRNVIFIHGSFRIVDSVVGESKIRTWFAQNSANSTNRLTWYRIKVYGSYLSVGLSMSKQHSPQYPNSSNHPVSFTFKFSR